MRLLSGMRLLTPEVYEDERGSFFEVWRASELDVHFVQANQSGSRRGVLRGLHYQLRQPQGKLVRVLSGRVWDVAVDLRRSSPDFGRWTAMELSADGRSLWIPPGFAHGFLTLSERAELSYLVTAPWDPESERVLAWDALDIPWPLSGAPVLSERDAGAPGWGEADLYP